MSLFYNALYCTYLQLGKIIKSINFYWLIDSFFHSFKKWGKSLQSDCFPVHNIIGLCISIKNIDSLNIITCHTSCMAFGQVVFPHIKMTEHYLDLALMCHSMYWWKCKEKKPKLDQLCITCPHAILCYSLSKSQTFTQE